MPPVLQRVVRLDSMPMFKAKFTDEGYLVDKPVLTSVGIFEYRNRDGSLRRELRLPEEVFDEESLKSFKGKPIIVTHDAGLIDKSNVHDETIGTILSNGYKSGDDVRAEIIIHDTDEMKDSGLKELSLGYNLELDETPGEWHGEHYDAIQRNIRVNHLALVREARAGERARLNIDGRDSETNILQGGKSDMRKNLKKVRRNDGILSPEELAKAIEEYKKRRAAGNADAEEEEAMPTEEPKEEVVADADEEEAKEPETVEDKVQFVKDRRDRRDEDGDPKSQKEAMGIIANQDEDIDILFDIIDTLLAERDFKENKDAEEEEKPAALEDPDEIAGDADEEEEVPTDEDEVVQDADDEEEAPAEEEEEIVEDADDDDEEVPAEEDEELAQDAEEEEIPEDEEEEIVEDADDDEEEEAFDCGGSSRRMDSIDRIVTEKLNVAMLGRQVGLNGLEMMPIGKAKAKIIKAVRPNVRLDGKSQEYRRAMYDMCVDAIKKSTKKDTKYQKKQMFNKDSRTDVSKKSGQEIAREKMVERMTNRV